MLVHFLFVSWIQFSDCLLNLFRNLHLMSPFFRPDIWYTFNTSYQPRLAAITLQTYSEERGILLHSPRISVLTHTQAAAGDCEMLTGHARVCSLMHFLTVTTGLAPSHISETPSHLTAALLSHKPPWISPTIKTDSTLVLIFFFYSPQRWNFTRTSMTWLWRKGWRAGSCTRQWKASRGTSPFWRWDVGFLYFPLE